MPNQATPRRLLRRSPFPPTFFLANTMEIFERMAWYGTYALLTLYFTDTKAQGGLGLRAEQSGMIIGIVPFILYLMPVFTGALADRFGYKKMLLLAYLILTPAYYLLGELGTYGGFFFGYLVVAVGAAIFKPVVVGTVARTTDQTNSQLGFGIFYMMINVGGFCGPLLAGIVRHKQPDGTSTWHNIFIASSLFIACNFFWLLFYREPTTESASAARRRVRKVLVDAVEVLGNLRFFLAAFGVLVLFMVAGQGWLTWRRSGLYAAAWLLANISYDFLLRLLPPTRRRDNQSLSPNDQPASSQSDRPSSSQNARPAPSRSVPTLARPTGPPGVRRSALLTPMRLGNWRFAVYILILGGFWTAFNQLFITMNLYIRDFVNTTPLIHFTAAFLRMIGATDTAKSLGGYAAAGGQVNPEYLVNIDALCIVLLQLLMSLIVQRLGRFPGMIVGVVLVAVGIGLPVLCGAGSIGVLQASGWVVVAGIFIFALGEMMASPTSQEYIASIAPPDKVALYMGYYFVAGALGALFSGVLSGQLYGALARDRGRPDLMFAIFGGLGLLTAGALWFYNRYAVQRHGAQAG